MVCHVTVYLASGLQIVPWIGMVMVRDVYNFWEIIDNLGDGATHT